MLVYVQLGLIYFNILNSYHTSERLKLQDSTISLIWRAKVILIWQWLFIQEVCIGQNYRESVFFVFFFSVKTAICRKNIVVGKLDFTNTRLEMKKSKLSN